MSFIFLIYFFFPCSFAALNHWRWLLWPRHECTSRCFRDGTRQASLFRCCRQNDLCDCLRLQEPLFGLRRYKKWTSQEGKEQTLGWVNCIIDSLINGSRDLVSLVKMCSKSRDLGILDWRMDSRKAYWLSGESAESAVFCSKKVCVLEWKRWGRVNGSVCVLLRKKLCECVFGGKGFTKAPKGFLFLLPSLSDIFQSPALPQYHISHIHLFTPRIRWIRYSFPLLWTCLKSRALGGQVLAHISMWKKLARQLRSACCTID